MFYDDNTLFTGRGFGTFLSHAEVLGNDLEILRRAVCCGILMGGNMGSRAVIDMGVGIKIGN